MRFALPFTVAALTMFATGCSTTIINQFRGEIRSVDGTNQTETLRCDIDGYCDGPSVTDGRYVGFLDLPASNNCSIYLSYPKASLSRGFATNTAPPAVDAWLIYSHGYPETELENAQIDKSRNIADLRLFGGEQLTGKIAARWNDNADFKIAVDLTATNGDAVHGEFVGYTKMEFDPGSIFAGLAMLFFGDGASIGVNTNLPAIGAPTIQDSHVLETPTYRIIIARHPEIKPSLDNATCTCVNKKDGKTIELSGKTIPTTGRHIFGYIFKNGATIYMIGDEGELQITQGPKILLDEKGTWK